MLRQALNLCLAASLTASLSSAFRFGKGFEASSEVSLAPEEEKDTSKTMSVEMTARPGGLDKYAAFRSNMQLTPYKSTYDLAYEAIFGVSQEQQEFEQKVAVNNRATTSRHHLKAVVQQELKNDYGWSWVGGIWLGKRQSLDVVFDTGSDWLVIEGQDCSNCEGDRYDNRLSLEDGTAKELTSKSTERYYGSAQVTGKEYSDVVCIELVSCVFGFKYFHVESQQGLFEPVDGILGLARPNPFLLDPAQQTETPPLYVLALSESRAISENTISFYFQGPSKLSVVHIGTPQKSYIRASSDIEYIDVLDDFFWSAYNQGVGIGSTNDTDVFAYHTEEFGEYNQTVNDHSVYTIIDTGSNAIYFSALYYETLIRKIFSYVGGEAWAMKDGIIQTKCYDFPPLFFMFDGKWIQVDADDYVLDYSVAQDRSLCILMLFPQDTAYHVMGMPLFVGYYAMHEMDNNRIGFAPHKKSDKPSLVRAKQPATLFNGNPRPEKDVERIVGSLLDYESATQVSWWVAGIVLALAYGAYIGRVFVPMSTGSGPSWYESLSFKVALRWILLALYLVLTAYLILGQLRQGVYCNLLNVELREDCRSTDN